MGEMRRGNVFANGQTGNLVLLGLRAAQKEEYTVIVVCFIGGAMLGAILTDRFGGKGLGLVIILLAIVLAALFMRKPILDFCEKRG